MIVYIKQTTNYTRTNHFGEVVVSREIIAGLVKTKTVTGAECVVPVIVLRQGALRFPYI